MLEYKLTQNEKGALKGTSGVPSGLNTFVTGNDVRIKEKIVYIYNDYTIKLDETTIMCSGKPTLTLFKTDINTIGRVLNIKNIGSDTVTVGGCGNDTIDSDSPFLLYSQECITIKCVAVGIWVII